MRRRLTRREKNKRNKQIIMVSSICLLVVMVSGYAAFQTNLSITAKGNIKQKKAADMLRELCNTESGDGLYKDIYEDGKCTYKGTDPNNYITFNNEIWRIVSVNNDKTIKIIKQYGIQYKWDSSESNNWDRPSDIKTYLNGEYLVTINTNQDKIVSHTWNIGPVINKNNNLIDQINDENKVQSQLAYIGLITASEYLRANSNMEQCENFALNNTNHNICSTTNWIFPPTRSSNYMELITPVYNSSNLIYIVDLMSPGGSIQSNTILTGPVSLNIGEAIFPVIYLSQDITLSGSGTSQDPYIITN